MELGEVYLLGEGEEDGGFKWKPLLVMKGSLQCAADRDD